MATHPSQLPVDQELKKAFQVLQAKMINTTQQLKISDAQIESLKRTIQHSKLVDHEISTLPEDTRVYEGAGRMFILQPLNDVKKCLTEKVTAAGEKIKTIEGSKAYLERSIKESEENLREMVLSRQQHR
ncbi:hypothetical protein ScPMuIL_004633 [Solemya velum]